MQESEEDHKCRLEQCKLFFTESLKENLDINCDDQINLIVAYLHDFWSVIRSEASKQLSKNANSLSNLVINALFTQLSSKLSSAEINLSWQEIHGNILGLIALLPHLCIEYHGLIRDHCFYYIGHVNIPVRESAGQCLTQLFNLSVEKTENLHSLLLVIREMNQHPESHSECLTLRLDGCLSSMNTMLSVYLDPSQAQQSPYDWKGFIHIIHESFYHPASSVRQKAGGILLTLLTPRTHKNNTQGEEMSYVIPYIVEEILVKTLGERQESWRAQEVCVMIADEWVRRVTRLSLSTPFSPPPSPPLPTPSPLSPLFSLSPVFYSSLSSLCQTLSLSLCSLLSQEEYEVRRVGEQTLPTLSRATLLFSLPIPSALSPSLSPSSPSPFSLSFAMLSLSHLVMAHRLLLQTLLPLPPLEQWGAEGRGRLQEREEREESLHLLGERARERGEECWEVLEEREGELVGGIEGVVERGERELGGRVGAGREGEGVGEGGVEGGRREERGEGVYLSSDFVEFFALSLCFLQEIGERVEVRREGERGGLEDREKRRERRERTRERARRVQERLGRVFSPLFFFCLGIGRGADSTPPLLRGGGGWGEPSPSKKGRGWSVLGESLTLSPVQFLLFSSLSPLSALSPSLSSPPAALQWSRGEGVSVRGVSFLPPLSDPSTHPLLYLLPPSPLSTPPPKPPASLPTSPSLPLSPPRPPLSPLSPQPSPQKGRPTSGTSPLLRPPSVDRWHADTLSPFLSSLSRCLGRGEKGGVGGVRGVLWLLSLSLEWLLSAVKDTLWLNLRSFSRKSLGESLSSLSCALLSALPSLSAEEVERVRLLSLLWVGTIGETLLLSPLSDLRALSPLLKTLLLSLPLASALPLSSLSHTLGGMRERAGERGVGVGVGESGEGGERGGEEKEGERVVSRLSSSLLSYLDTLLAYWREQEKIPFSPSKKTEKHPLSPPSPSSSLPSLPSPSSPSLRTDPPYVEGEEAGGEGGEGGEFSDWDEESEASEGERGAQVEVEVSGERGGRAPLASLLEELEAARELVRRWREAVEDALT